MKPEFAQALEKCASFSGNTLYTIIWIGSKGKSVYLLKTDSKRKRSRQEIEEAKEEEKKFKDEKQDLIRELN